MPGCPCCSPELQTATCEVCEGTGLGAYYDSDGEEITREQYNLLPEKRREADKCEVCDGAGKREYDYENFYFESR